MSQKIDYGDLKKSGYIVQRDPSYFTVRLRVSGGNLSSEQLVSLGKIADKYGRGQTHLTARQGLQIPYVRYEKLGEITEELTEIGTPPGSSGPRVRNTSACVGEPECSYANINSYELAKKIDEKYFDRDIPIKLKIGITGCPNSCGKPQVNDIGIMGVVKPKIVAEKCGGCGICVEICKEAAIRLVRGIAVVGYTKCVYCGECIRVCPRDACIAERKGYTIFVGGRVGRHPQLGYKLIEFADEKTIFSIIEKSTHILRDEAMPGERFGGLIDRMGIGEFARRLLS